LICVVMLLTVQWTWVAAAAYCVHNGKCTAAHVGHHEHVHQSAATDAEQAKVAGLGDVDCDYCHLGCASWPPVAHPVLALPGDAPERGIDPLFPGSHIGACPERPDRALAV